MPSGYLESIGYQVPTESLEEENDVTISSQIESVDGKLGQSPTEPVLQPEERPDLKNVDYSGLNSNNSEVRRKQLDNIAEAALEFQPRGYTLETTEVSYGVVEFLVQNAFQF